MNPAISLIINLTLSNVCCPVNNNSQLTEVPTKNCSEEVKPSEYSDDVLPRNCTETLKPWKYPGDVFKIKVPKSASEEFDVYRIENPEGGPKWTIIQRRMDGSVNFTRNWTEYESGFGNVNGEYFLGLKKIHELTNIEPNELWVELTDYKNETRYAKYGVFSIGNATQKYILNVGNFSGCLADSMKYHNGIMFSTYDNDKTPGNCGHLYASGWWMKACYECNLNGKYLQENEKTVNGARGIKWLDWDELNRNRANVSLKYAHMAIRPVRLSASRG